MESADGQAPPGGVGAALARARTEHDMSVEDVSRLTRIRATLIRQIESDDFAGCGAPVYARGHIRSIAHAVGADDAPLIEEFDRQRGAEPAPIGPSLIHDHDKIAARDMRSRRGARWVPAMVASLAVVLALGIVGLVAGGSSSGNASASGSTPSATPKKPPATTPAPARTTPPPAVAFSGVDVRIQIASSPSWLSVRDDSQHLLLQQVLQPGDVRDFKAPKGIKLVLGNAGAVTMSCNGHSFGSPGGPGQVVTVAFGLGSAGDCTAG